MKKLIFILFAVQLILVSCKSKQSANNQKQKDTKDYYLKDLNYRPKYYEYNHINSKDLVLLKEYLKTTFGKDLDSLNYLTISYIKTLNMCWYDSYSGINSSRTKSLFDNFKNQMNTDLLCAHYDERASTFSLIDDKKYFINYFQGRLKLVILLSLLIN